MELVSFLFSVYVSLIMIYTELKNNDFSLPVQKFDKYFPYRNVPSNSNTHRPSCFNLQAQVNQEDRSIVTR
jgi:hypothetical protein